MNSFLKLLLALALAVVAVSSSVAFAAKPTPTAAPTSTVTPTPTATPTPQPVASFWGTAWLDAGNVVEGLTARIGDVQCGDGGRGINPTDTNVSHYSLDVVSDQVKAGCGHDGAIITFFINGQQAEQTAVWHAGSQFLNLIAGHPFARFEGYLNIQRDVDVVPFIGGKPCGRDIAWGLLGASSILDEIVYSADQQAGCGVEGSWVVFKLVDGQGNVLKVADQTAVWHAWDGDFDSTTLNLTFAAGVGGPSVGTGDAARSGMSFLPLAATLLALGVIALGASLTLLRRRYKTSKNDVASQCPDGQ